ncbi:MAG: AraC family transcriptional regulator [Lachnospiraceae bacterium]|nr:AraC family transcriptional regulator [Lachnospiraceae bacterium]
MPPQDFPLHNHDFFELLYVYHGSAVQKLQHETRILRQHTACLFTPNVQHCIYTKQEDDILINILINPKVFQKSFSTSLSENDLIYRFFADTILRDNTETKIIYFENSSDRISTLVESIVLEYINEQPCYQSTLQAYLLILFNELIRDHVSHFNQQNIGSCNTSKIISYIYEHLSTVTLTNLADEFHYSSNYISKMLKDYTGKNYSTLIQDMRLEKATHLLTEENLSPKDTTLMLSFYDTSYFTKVFKKKYLLTPAQYKKMKCRETSPGR